jgi:hypothetical protein
MTRSEKIRLIAAVKAGRVKPEDLQEPDFSRATTEELTRLARIRDKYDNTGRISAEDQAFIDSLVEAIKVRPPQFVSLPVIKQGLAEGKSLIEIARDMHTPWQDIEPVKKVIEYAKLNNLL